MESAMVDNLAAAGAGFIGMVFFAIYPLFRARPTILVMHIGNSLGFLVHYALLGQWTAAAMNALLSVQTFVAIMLARAPGMRWTCLLLIGALVLTSIATWQGTSSFLSAAATTLSIIGSVQTNETVLRVLLLMSTPLWAAHDMIVDSLPGLIADLLSIASGGAMLLCRWTGLAAKLIDAMQPLTRLVARLGPSGRTGRHQPR
jgi:Bacterial inner membrane protein